MRNRYLYTILIIMVLGSCKTFLTEVPDNRVEVDNEEKIKNLLVFAYPNADHYTFTSVMSDGAIEHDNTNAVVVQEQEAAFKFRDFTSSTTVGSTTHYWNGCYQAISYANQALLSLENLGNPADLNYLRGEALVARAYAHFMLVSLFSLRYHPDEASEQLGIPYVTAPERNAFVNYARGTMKETYDNVRRDLEEGLTLVENGFEKPKFHFGVEASNAFATRFYLFIGEWDKVIETANKVFDGKIESDYVRNYTSKTYTDLSFSEKRIFYTKTENPTNILLNWVNSRFARVYWRSKYATYGRINSDFILDDQNPYGLSWAFPTGLSRSIAGSSSIPKFIEYFKITNVLANTGNANSCNIHFTYDEVILNRAEAYAMKNRYGDAIKDMETFATPKSENYNPAIHKITDASITTRYPYIENEYTPFYPLTTKQASYVKALSLMKRVEHVHMGLRWFDVKRFDLRVVHQFSGGKTAVLVKGDLRRAIQTPELTLDFGLVANPR